MNAHAPFCALAAVFLGIGVSISTSTAAENLVTNPSAEQAAADGRPEGWGLYVGAGRMQLARTVEETHSGQRAACLELTDWHTPKQTGAPLKTLASELQIDEEEIERFAQIK